MLVAGTGRGDHFRGGDCPRCDRPATILDTDPCTGVSASRHKHVDGGMEGHTVHTTQMTMVVADHLQTNSLYYNDNQLVLFDLVCS